MNKADFDTKNVSRQQNEKLTSEKNIKAVTKPKLH